MEKLAFLRCFLAVRGVGLFRPTLVGVFLWYLPIVVLLLMVAVVVFVFICGVTLVALFFIAGGCWFLFVFFAVFL